MPLADLEPTPLFYERTGPSNGTPLVLIHGFGAQMITWHPQLCDRLSDAGFNVVRFDNRDVGLSAKLDGHPHYTLEDMAGDVAALIEHLGLGPVHVLGQSMGGMIAQRLAIGYPSLVASLCLVYTTPDLSFVTDDPEFVALASQSTASTRSEAIEQWVRKEHFSGTNGFDLVALAEKVYDRCYCPDGLARQWAAIQASDSVVADLKSLTMPTAIIHGRADRLIPYEASLAIAAAIPYSDLHMFAEMGHELPPALWPEVVQVLTRTARRADPASTQAKL